MSNRDEEVIKRIKLLEEKYNAMGQDLVSYLDGLLLSNYLTYWDYVDVDTLLSLQKPRTDFPDEIIFIMYHQITELYFKLCLHELNQIASNGRNVLPNGHDLGWNTKLEVPFFTERLRRVNRYFEALTKSFDIMVDGMDPRQFRLFRMALLPASGFQSAQYRKIEIYSTGFINLVDKEEREKWRSKTDDISGMFEYIYWKKGATELETQKKTLTLEQFEKKYADEFIALGNELKSKNIWAKYKSLSPEEQKNKDLINQMRQFDLNVNVLWPLVHYKSAVRYLQISGSDVPATGGTNWQKYLPPRFQKRIFYPELWNEKEKDEWGKIWVEKEVLNK